MLLCCVAQNDDGQELIKEAQSLAAIPCFPLPRQKQPSKEHEKEKRFRPDDSLISVAAL
jgi:hypothetical protein